MALRQFNSMAHDDDQLYDLSKGMGDDYEPPEFPSGLCFAISKEDLEEAGGEGAAPGATMRFAAMGEVMSTFHGTNDCRIELELTEFAGEDGKFFDLSSAAHICFSGAELAKIDLESDAERGDMIHLIGEVRVESMSSTEYGGDMVMLQVTALTYEDESEESREG